MVSQSPRVELPRLLRAAATVDRVFKQLNLQFCVIGGLALFRWGEPRLTRDVDLTVICPIGDEQVVVRSILEHVEARLPDAESYAIRNRVLLLRAEGMSIDVGLGVLDFEYRVIARASQFAYAKNNLITTCSAEDLVVMKAFANRGQDWVDIENVMHKQGKKLDWSIIEAELPPLLALKEEPEIFDRLLKLKEKVHA